VITIATKAEMHAYTARARAAGRRVGLVPTMGAFHAGHHALMRAAREACGEVVVSLFVNPTQFNEAGDLEAYPRTEERDAAEARELGVDVLFSPAVEGLSDVLEGAQRGPGHFAGVCTVVAKLLNIVAPDVAFFGQKDAQQVAVLRRMAADLDLPVALEVVPTVREPDGLALSSRNVRLDAGERERAVALSRALAAAEAAIGEGERDAARLRGPRWGRCAPTASSPSTSRSSTPSPSPPSTPSTAACSSPWPRG
jgi:pantoate--beta-alanine ligase